MLGLINIEIPKTQALLLFKVPRKLQKPPSLPLLVASIVAGAAIGALSGSPHAASGGSHIQPKERSN